MFVLVGAAEHIHRDCKQFHIISNYIQFRKQASLNKGTHWHCQLIVMCWDHHKWRRSLSDITMDYIRCGTCEVNLVAILELLFHKADRK